MTLMDYAKIMWAKIIATVVLLAAYYALFPLPLQTNLIRFFAMAGFYLLSVSLIIGPLAVLFPKSFCSLIKHRKRVGNIAFMFVVLHFALVLYYFYSLNITALFLDLNTIMILLALVLFFVLAITSADTAIRMLGFSRWKLIQRTAYIVFALSFFHFVFNANGLFVPLAGGRVFVNLAEIAMILVGILTIVFQLLGFVTMLRTNRKKAEEVCPIEPPAPQQ